MKDTAVTACGGWGKSYFLNHLCLWAFRTHAGGSQFDHLCQLGDGFGRGVGSLGQFLLAGCGSSNQQLGVLHQGFGCLQDALPGGRDTRRYGKNSTPMGVNHKRFCLLKYECWNAQCPSVSHWKWEVWLLHQRECYAPWHQVICCPFCCTCDRRRSLHSRGSAFQPRQTWWWCPGQRWCQKRRWRLWCRLGCLCSRPAAPTAPKTPATGSML